MVEAPANTVGVLIGMLGADVVQPVLDSQKGGAAIPLQALTAAIPTTKEQMLMVEICTGKEGFEMFLDVGVVWCVILSSVLAVRTV